MQAAWHGEPSGAGLNEAGFPGDRATVAVIIPTFNQARFLAEAIMSVLAQTRPADEIIVVDDGSTDDPATVVARFQKVRLIRQDNRGPSAARNTALRSCKTSHVVFLDADDRLMPTALDAGLACIADRPDSAFVYGGYRLISENGHPIGLDCVNPIDGDAHLALLRINPVGTVSCALHRRDYLLEVNGFDETLRRVEDYDLYLRIAQRYPIASHPEIVAEYRRHGQNTSNDLKKMYLGGRAVLDRHKARIASDTTALAVLEEELVNMPGKSARRMLRAASADWRTRQGIRKIMWNLAQAAQLSPFLTMRLLLGGVYRNLSVYLPDNILIQLRFIVCHGYIPSVKNPKTFNEWVINKMLFDRDPLLTLTADKFAVRDYVKERCGEKILIPLLQVVDRIEDINFDQLPDKFVLKPTHASGLVEIVKDKSLINKDELFVRLNSWLKLNFYEVGREWQYKNIPPRIIAEQALLDINNQPPPDYKLYVFHGVVRMINIVVGRFSQRREGLFDREWKLLNVSYTYPSAGYGDQPMPSKLDEMIAIAETLGREFLFTRIDLYEHNNRVYFGEITHTSDAGLGTFNPREFDRTLGEILNTGAPIPARYRMDRV